MSSFDGFLLLFILAFAVVFVARGQGLPPEFTRWHVYVINGLSEGRTLFVHCKSTDDDLGGRNLDPGTNFNWSFRQHVFHRTLFWCYVSKANDNDDDGAHASFDVFWQDVILFHKCSWKDCIWIAKDDGIYIKDLARNTDEFRREWEPGLLQD
ncbi:S-protein homologue 1 [Hibiscus trionum]|uniref:S-protein homolog n=1 Tax=Hibiscus trionum TaxID=183268 RepID=A0A9W7HAK1_HIBTR|nr:S-protein homologue 1 [Hibiscus trionum]